MVGAAPRREAVSWGGRGSVRAKDAAVSARRAGRGRSLGASAPADAAAIGEERDQEVEERGASGGGATAPHAWQRACYLLVVGGRLSNAFGGPEPLSSSSSPRESVSGGGFVLWGYRWRRGRPRVFVDLCF